MSGETLAVRVCSDSECEQASRKRGMCEKHYLRWWKATPPSERLPPTLEERFWAKVQKAPGCWIWTAAKRPSGHGYFNAGPGRPIAAGAFSLELALGYSVPSGLWVLHHCDNPPCVNPKHLYYGTPQDNINDAWARNRMPVGSKRPAAVLTEDQVVAMRIRYAAGADARELAAEFGIAVSTLRLTVLGRKWAHVGGPILRRRPKRQDRKVA